MPHTPKPSKSEMDYRAEDDHRTLTRAEEIRMDASRLAGVKKHHEKMTRVLARTGKSLFATSMTRVGRRPAGTRSVAKRGVRGVRR